MAGKRQHFIPQLFSRAFTDQRGFVAVLRKSGEAFSTSTENIGLEGKFYGDPGPGTADDSITHEEKKIKELLSALASAPDGRCDSVIAAHLFSHLTSRTRAVRSLLTDVGHLATDVVSRILSDQRTYEKALLNFLEVSPNLIEETVDAEVLRAQGPTGLAVFRGHPARSWTLALARHAVPSLMKAQQDNLPSGFDALIREVRSGVAGMVAKIHTQQALSDPTPAVRAQRLAALNYSVRSSEEPLILGDSVGWGLRGDGQVRSVVTNDADLRVVVMPLSPKRLLLGWTDVEPELKSDFLNIGSASASIEFILSRPPGTELPQYAPHIGLAGGGLLGDLLAMAESEWQISPSNLPRLSET